MVALLYVHIQVAVEVRERLGTWMGETEMMLGEGLEGLEMGLHLLQKLLEAPGIGQQSCCGVEWQFGLGFGSDEGLSSLPWAGHCCLEVERRFR